MRIQIHNIERDYAISPQYIYIAAVLWQYRQKRIALICIERKSHY